METTVKKQYKKRYSSQPSSRHLFFYHHSTSYLLLLQTNSALCLYNCNQENFTCIVNQNLKISQPVGLYSGNGNTICLLTKTEVLFWTFDQLHSNYSPVRFQLSIQTQPVSLIHLKDHHFMVLCQDATIKKFKGGSANQTFSIPNEMDIHGMISHQCRQPKMPFILIPSTTKNYPYLFDQKDLLSWHQQNFFQKHIEQCKNYYLEDQILQQEKHVYCFSPTQKLMCVYVNKLVSMFQILNTEGQALKYTIKLRMSVKVDANEPLFCYLNDITGTLIRVGSKKIVQSDFLHYRDSKKALRQRNKDDKSDRVSVRYAYTSGHDELVMLNQGADLETKIHLCKFSFSQ